MADTERKRKSTNSGPPDIAGIEAEMESYWSGRNSLIDELEQIRFMQRPIEHPDTIEVEEVRSSIGYSIVERVTGMLTDNPRRCSVPPAAETQKAKDASEKIEKFAPVALDEVARISEDEPDARMIENLVAYGHGCQKLVYAPARWAGFPRQKKGQDDKEYNEAAEQWKKGRPLPIAWSSLDPRTVFPRWDELGLAMILERDERPVIDLHPERYNRAKEFPELWEFDRLKGGLSTVHFSQLWTRETLTYAVNGQVVHHQRHNYGAPPYVYSMGTTTSNPDPTYRGLGLLFPLRYLLPYLDRLLSQKGTAVRIWAWPTPVIKHSMKLLELNPMSAEPPQIEVIPGKAVNLWGDSEVTFLTWAGNGPDADEQLRLIMQMIERAGLADVLYGQGVGSGDSGYLVNQLISAARMKLRPIIRHAEIAMERVIVLLLDVIEYQVGQTLHVYQYGKQSEGQSSGWISLGPDDIKGYRQVRVELIPQMPTDEYAVAQMAMNLKRERLWSRERAMQRVNVEQPETEKRTIAVEEFEDSPEVRAAVLPEVLKRFGFKVAPQEPAPADVLQQMPGLSPGLQQAVLQQMAGGQAGGAAGPQPGQPQGQGQPGPVEVAAQMLAQGMAPQQVVQQLVQMGLPLQQAMQAVQQAMQMLADQQGQGGGVSAIQAAPGVLAAPGPPTPQGSMSLPVRGAGMATGRAPGVKMRGSEG
jgi:hypothetical protein